jgi:hypothetical protein
LFIAEAFTFANLIEELLCTGLVERANMIAIVDYNFDTRAVDRYACCASNKLTQICSDFLEFNLGFNCELTTKTRGKLAENSRKHPGRTLL